jgi:anaerobic magnesium-protoporphyrin IX monomethyl ester cyclase
MKVLFIYPDHGTDVMSFCSAIHVLSAILKEDGHETYLLHINNQNGIKYDKKIIIEQSKGYDLFAVTSTSFSYKYANEIAGWLKDSYPDVLRVLGGSHATIQPEDFESSNFDIFCVGEGDEPMKELCHALQTGDDWTKISNLITRFGRNPIRGFFRDLNKLPYWDFDIMDTNKILRLRQNWLTILFARGCSYSCTFCINHLYKKIEIGPTDKMSDYIRKRSPDIAVNELEILAKKFPVKIFNVADDLLTMDKKWIRKFTEDYREKIFKPFGIKYSLNARADSLTEEVVKMLSDSGCFEARIGFETGNEKIRNELLRKKITNESLYKAFTAIHKYGMNAVAFTMMGLPGESHETFQETVDMINKLKPRLIRMTFLFPYKHTAIYDICIERGLFKDNYEKEDNRDDVSPLIFEKLSDKELFCFKFLFPWYVNLIMLKDNTMSGLYLEAINHFKQFTFEQLRDMIDIIIEQDTFLSNKCGKPHYKYFSEQLSYFELYNPLK